MFIFMLFFQCIFLCSVNLKCIMDDKGMSMQISYCEVYSLFILVLCQDDWKPESIKLLQPFLKCRQFQCQLKLGIMHFSDASYSFISQNFFFLLLKIAFNS